MIFSRCFHENCVFCCWVMPDTTQKDQYVSVITADMYGLTMDLLASVFLHRRMTLVPRNLWTLLKPRHAQQSCRQMDAVEGNSAGKYRCQRFLVEMFPLRLGVAMNQLYCRVLRPCHRYEHGIRHTMLHPSMRLSPCLEEDSIIFQWRTKKRRTHNLPSSDTMISFSPKWET